MIPEIGHLALIAALFVALAQGVLALAGAARANLTWIAFARPAARAQFLLVMVGFAALTWAFVAKDYSVAYVLSSRWATEWPRSGADMRVRSCSGC